MANTKPVAKMFIQIVRELQMLIQAERIRPGGKLPSERELAERLNVGRSSVREALRSLELLGLIETRRGEGTFLTDFRNHQLVEVLSAFVIQDNTSKENVHETRRIHEREAISIVTTTQSLRDLPVWKSLLKMLGSEEYIVREDLIREIMVVSGNRLSLKIWFLLKQYGEEPYRGTSTEVERIVLQRFLQHVIDGELDLALQAFDDWTNFLHRERLGE